MRSLFGKIFLWFCTTVVLGIVSTFLVAYLFNLPGPDNDASPINHLLRMSGRDMAEAYDQGGVQGLRSFIDVLKKRTDLNSRLYDLSGRDLSGLPPMDGFDEAARAHLDTVPMPSEEDRTKEMQDFSPLGPPGPPGAPRMHAPPDMSRHDMPIPTIRHRGLVVSRWTFTREGGTYLVVTHLPSPIKFLKRVAGRDFFFRLGVFFMAGVLFSYLLAKYLSQPVRRLQHAARKMRAGDLSVRVGEDKRLHYTEIHDLARDFDSMAERLERMIMAQRRLVRDVSHELRSPLTRLNLSLELARKRTGAEALETDLDRIGIDVARLQELIDEVLAFARMESIKEDAHTETVNLGALLVAVTRDADLEAQARDVALKVDVHHTAVLEANPELLRRAMENVIRNAIRHTPRRSTIDICLARLDEPPEMLLQIRDYGTGAPEDQLEDLFRPFFRADDSRTRSTGGTGLGLAIAARAVRLHGGRITASNAPGGGLVVDIHLPLQE